MKKGLTLIELVIVIVMLVILTGAAFYIFRAVLLSWGSGEKRTGIDISIGRGMEEVVRDLRKAKEVQSTAGYDEIRFTLDRSSYYIYYFYNSADSYLPPPAFDRASYQLRKAALTGGINGSFNYGGGRLMLTDLSPPATSSLSVSGNIVTIDLTVTRGDEAIRLRTKVKPRNL